MTKKRKMKAVLLLLGAMELALLTGCGSTAQLSRYQDSFLDVFDTASMVIGYTETEKDFQTAEEQVHDALLEYHQLFDIYDEYEGINNLKTVNDAAGQHPVSVDAKIMELLKLGQEVYTLTDGKVNIASGSLLSVWHNYREAGIDDPDSAALPSEAELQEAAQHMDIQNMILDEENNTVYLADPEMRLDVGGIAKGFATEKAAELVQAAGNEHFLLNIGGNVRTLGTKGDGSSWVCPVENPEYADTGKGEEYAVVTELDDRSLVTSGDYERYYTVDGKRYHHIIDPETLYPADYHRSVSILTGDSALADALSTGLFLMSEEDGRALLEKLNQERSEDDQIEALWINADGEISYTSGFSAYLQK